MWVEKGARGYEIWEAPFPGGIDDKPNSIGRVHAPLLADALIRFESDHTPLAQSLCPEYDVPTERWPLTTLAMADFEFDGAKSAVLVAAGFKSFGADAISPQQFCLAVQHRNLWMGFPLELAPLVDAIRADRDVFETAIAENPGAIAVLTPYFPQAQALLEQLELESATPPHLTAPTGRMRI